MVLINKQPKSNPHQTPQDTTSDQGIHGVSIECPSKIRIIICQGHRRSKVLKEYLVCKHRDTNDTRDRFVTIISEKQFKQASEHGQEMAKSQVTEHPMITVQ